MTPQKAEYARKGGAVSMEEALKGADFFLGLAGPGVLSRDGVRAMARQPIIFGLANPVPEILPEDAKAVAPDAIIATGRSDYPNQVNNVLCFPFMFRGALDVGATEINEEMKVAAAHALARLARATSSAEAAAAYQGERMVFGPEYLIPKPFDRRLMPEVATAVARAAMDSGVATRPVDPAAYHERLNTAVFRTAMVMKSVFEAARNGKRKVIFAEGEDERVLRTAQAMLEEGIDTPILIGRPDVLNTRCERYGLAVKPGVDFEVVNPQDDPRYREYWETYHRLMERRGVTPALARAIMRTNTTAIAAVAVHLGHADSLVCGTFGQYSWHLKYVSAVLARDGLRPIGALSLVLLEKGAVFIADTYVHPAPTAEEIAETAIAAARHVRRFGIEPHIAMCSHSQFGNLDDGTGPLMRKALAILDSEPRDFVYEGEMHSDSALLPELRERIFPNSRLKGAANVLIFAVADAASASRNVLKALADGLEVGPILMGMGNKAHIVTPSISARGLLNVAALAGTPVQEYG